MPTKRTGVVMASLLLYSLTAGAAGVYKWVDEQGRVHYGDRPSTHTQSETVHVAPSPSSSSSALTPEQRLERQRQLLDAYSQERQQAREAAQKAQQEEEKRQRNCVAAKSRMHNYEQAGYLYDMSPNGERRILSDSERSRAQQQARADVAKWCDD